MLHILDEATDPWGISVERVEVKDVILPQSLQRAMAAEAEAAREAKAKVRFIEQEIIVKNVLDELLSLLWREWRIHDSANIFVLTFF